MDKKKSRREEDIQPLSRKCANQWEVATEHKNIISEVSKHLEKLAKDVAVVSEDHKQLAESFTAYAKRVQLYAPTTVFAQCIAQAAHFQASVIDLTNALNSAVTNGIGLKLRGFINDEYNNVKEKKKKFDKLRFDDSMRKDKKKTGTRRSQIDEKPSGNDLFIQIGSETLQLLEETNKTGEQQVLENIVGYFEAFQTYFERGHQLLKNMETNLSNYREDIKNRKRNLQKLKAQRYGGGNAQGNVFGVPLATILENDKSDVPKIVDICIKWLEAHEGLTTEGVFRISGNKTRLEDLKAEIDASDEIELEKLGVGPKDVHLVTGLLKAYLRSLPDPLMTFALYPRFIAIHEVPGKQEKIKTLMTVVQDLPKENKRLLQRILNHCVNVADHSDVNKMGPRNLGTVFSPTVMYTKDPNVATMVDDMEKATSCFTLLIEESKSFLPLLDIVEEPKVEKPVEKVEPKTTESFSERPSSPEKRLPDRSYSERAIGWKMGERRTTLSPNEKPPEKNSSSERIPEKNTSSEKIPEKIPDKNISSEKIPEKPVPNEKTPEDISVKIPTKEPDTKPIDIPTPIYKDASTTPSLSSSFESVPSLESNWELPTARAEPKKETVAMPPASPNISPTISRRPTVTIDDIESLKSKNNVTFASSAPSPVSKQGKPEKEPAEDSVKNLTKSDLPASKRSSPFGTPPRRDFIKYPTEKFDRTPDEKKVRASEALLETTPKAKLNAFIIQSVDAMYKFIIALNNPEQVTINNELKQIALSVRELNNCIKSMNMPNSTVATMYNELQEIFGKLVNTMKFANEQKDDHKAQMAVHLACKLYIAGIAKMFYANEEVGCTEDSEEIVTYIQNAVSIASNLMRSILSGADENIVPLSRQFLETTTSMVDFVSEKIMGLPHNSRSRAAETIESIRQASSDLLIHSRDYLSAADESSFDVLKEKITLTIKKLVKALRDTANIFDIGVTSEHTEEATVLYKNAQKFLEDSLALRDKETDSLMKQFVEKIQFLNEMIKQILREETTDKQKLILNTIVTTVGEVDVLMSSIAEKIITEAKKVMEVEDVELFGIQLKLVRNTVRKFLSHLKVNVAALTMKLDLQSKFPDKLNASESVDEVVNVLVLAVDSFANYFRSFSRDEEN